MNIENNLHLNTLHMSAPSKAIGNDVVNLRNKGLGFMDICRYSLSQASLK